MGVLEATKALGFNSGKSGTTALQYVSLQQVLYSLCSFPLAGCSIMYLPLCHPTTDISWYHSWEGAIWTAEFPMQSERST